ncbi:hypothetical protein [Natronohydrobacter thiooxidans]|uniref:hypothetical protein n=1 Tax=Natronohydrobacter thiooxidans TaxID=87172 RepID=UPI0008FF5505|nr:hypothetical protein [Natronohydrobacter thiooxidans]
MKHALLGLALTFALPALAQTAPELRDLDPDTLPPAPAESAAHDLTLPELYTSAEPDREVNGCIVPGRPDWLVEMNPATTNERMIVHGMQRLRWKQAVVESGECSCELRYPDWAAIISDFNENYALLDRQAMFEIDMAYHDKAAALRAEAAAICHEHGR